MGLIEDYKTRVLNQISNQEDPNSISPDAMGRKLIQLADILKSMILQGSLVDQGFAEPDFNPGIPTGPELYRVQTGATYINFPDENGDPIEVPVTIGGQAVIDATIYWDLTHWELAYDSVTLPVGPKGWSPKFVGVTDGIRIVWRLDDYVGGLGDKPNDFIGQYVSEGGYTVDIATALSFRGQPGNTGASAYQVAQANGFVGTQAQWLASLQGPVGAPGGAEIQLWTAAIYTVGRQRRWIGTVWETIAPAAATDIPGSAPLVWEDVNSRKTNNNDFDQLSALTTAIQVANNSFINNLGGVTTSAGYTIKYLEGVPTDRFRLIMSATSSGANQRMPYGFYSALPISEATFLSGGVPAGGVMNFDGEVSMPAGGTIFAFSDQNNTAKVFRRGVSLLNKSIADKAEILAMFGLTERLKPIWGFNKVYLATDGNLVTSGSAGNDVKFFYTIPGRKYRIRTVLGGTGGTSKLPYAWYSGDTPSSAVFISGGAGTTAAINLDAIITAPAGAYFLIIHGSNQEADFVESEVVPTNELTIDPAYRRAYTTEFNLAPAPFKRLRNSRIDGSTSTIQNITGNNAGIDAVTFPSTPSTTLTYTTARKELGREYTLKRIDLGAFTATSEPIFSMERSMTFAAYTICLWINVADLNGNNLIVGLFGLDVIRNVDLKKIGGGIRSGGVIASVDAISGDYSHLTLKISATNDRSRFLFYVDSNAGTAVTQMRVIRPYIFEGAVNIDPYAKHISLPEYLGSQLIGDRFAVFADSQGANLQTFTLTKRNGCSVHHCQEGGRAIKYRTAVATYDNDWLYHWNRMKMLASFNADCYVFHLSTNDGSGGGILSEATINDVLNNYPNINDTDPAVIANKLAIFNAMTVTQRQAMFNFKPVMGALIRQIMIFNQNARILLCTIPLSRSAETTYEGIRNRQTTVYTPIKNDIYEVGAFFNAPVLDINSMVNLTAENAVTHEPDGTHWGPVIHQRIGMIVSNKALEFSL